MSSIEERVKKIVIEHLGVEATGHRQCLVEVGLVIDIDMTNPVQVFNHRHACIFRNTFNQALATAWYDYIHILLHPDQFADGLPISRLYHLYSLCRQTGFL